MTNLNEVVSFIAKCSNEERKTIVDALSVQVINATKQLRIGAFVKFTSNKRKGAIIEGKITKINKKTVKLNCFEHGRWTVSPHLLTLIK